MAEHKEQGCNCSGDSYKENKSFIEQPHKSTKINKIIGIVSGKGGVGKSLVTSLLANAINKKGYKTAIMDADITGPSIPKIFGITQKPINGADGFFPVLSKDGIDIMSINLLLDNETDPVIWRGPVIAGIIKQFWKDVIWSKQDVMFIDMPPGTGDVPLTIFQSIPVDGIIIVTSPQDLVSMIVEKAFNMAKMMNISVLGIVENMSYIKCPNCNKEIKIFGESKIEEVAKKFNISVIDKLPIDTQIAQLCDNGEIEKISDNKLVNNVANIEKLLVCIKGDKMKVAVTYENGEVFQHFGHTENFKVYTIEKGKVVSSEIISSNGTGHESLAGMLKNLGINTLICGGIGGGAKEALAQEGLTVYPGTSGNADEVIKSFLDGTIKYNPNIQCSHHTHEEEHSCNGGGKSCSHHHEHN